MYINIYLSIYLAIYLHRVYSFPNATPAMSVFERKLFQGCKQDEDTFIEPQMSMLHTHSGTITSLGSCLIVFLGGIYCIYSAHSFTVGCLLCETKLRNGWVVVSSHSVCTVSRLRNTRNWNGNALLETASRWYASRCKVISIVKTDRLASSVAKGSPVERYPRTREQLNYNL